MPHLDLWGLVGVLVGVPAFLIINRFFPQREG